MYRKCVIATDNIDTFTRFTVPAFRLSEHFDGVLNSFERGVLKQDIDEQNPDRIPLFDEYLREYNLQCEDVVLIDDCIYKSGAYKGMGFDILQIFSPDDFLGKLKQLA